MILIGFQIRFKEFEQITGKSCKSSNPFEFWGDDPDYWDPHDLTEEVPKHRYIHCWCRQPSSGLQAFFKYINICLWSLIFLIYINIENCFFQKILLHSGLFGEESLKLPIIFASFCFKMIHYGLVIFIFHLCANCYYLHLVLYTWSKS